MHPKFKHWLTEQKYKASISETGKIYWVVRKDEGWGWDLITKDNDEQRF